MTSREHEHTLNVWLAGLLRDRGLNARQEVMHTGVGRVDVEVRIGPAVIAVECEHGQSAAKRAEAIGDADRRLNQELAHGAVAVCYPDDTDEASLPNARFVWAVRDAAGVAPNWTEGSLEQLVSVIRLTPASARGGGNPKTDTECACCEQSTEGERKVESRDTASKPQLPVLSQKT